MASYASSAAFIWHSYVVSIISRHGLRIKEQYRYQPNKIKLVLYKLLQYFYFKNSCTLVTRWNGLVTKVVV